MNKYNDQSDKITVILISICVCQKIRLFLYDCKYEVNLKYLQGSPVFKKI